MWVRTQEGRGVNLDAAREFFVEPRAGEPGASEELAKVFAVVVRLDGIHTTVLKTYPTEAQAKEVIEELVQRINGAAGYSPLDWDWSK